MDDELSGGADRPANDGEPAGYGQRRRARTGGVRRRPQAQGGEQRRPPREERPRPAPQVEPESAKPARALLEEILVKMGVDGDVRYYSRPEGEYFEVNGSDLANLIGRHGNTLEALNLVFNNIINAASVTTGTTTRSTRRAIAPAAPTSCAASRSRASSVRSARSVRSNWIRCCRRSARSSTSRWRRIRT